MHLDFARESLRPRYGVAMKIDVVDAVKSGMSTSVDLSSFLGASGQAGQGGATPSAGTVHSTLPALCSRSH